MSMKMIVQVNGETQVEYDREKTLPQAQLFYLDKMDESMNKGIQLADQWVDNPDIFQRSQFVASNLVVGLKEDNDQLIGAMCSYLALRIPDLKAIKVIDSDAGVEIDFVFNSKHVNQQKVDFTF